MSLALLLQWVSSGLNNSGACHLMVPPALGVELCDMTSVLESFAVARPKSEIQALLNCVMRTLSWNANLRIVVHSLDTRDSLPSDHRELYLASGCGGIPVLEQCLTPIKCYQYHESLFSFDSQDEHNLCSGIVVGNQQRSHFPSRGP